MERMFSFLDEPVGLCERNGASDIAIDGGSVSFEDVHFSYKDRPILQGISFTVPKGKRVAIVGPSGSGKTTISRLLFRFFDVLGGRVTVGGVDVRAVSQSSLRRLMGVVPQDTVLFNASLDYNIRYGKRGATELDRDEAAGRASLLPFVSNLEESWETVVGERGLKLSGGEKQRVAIARLFVKNPPVVILDEATSALDSRTEADIQDALTALSDTRTAVTIAHRLGTIAKCDAILVLKDGEVAERGTHDALIALKGEYAAMWEVQAKTNDFLVADETKEEAKEG